MLCSQMNETIVSPSLSQFGFETVLGVRSNEIVGTVGRCYDDLLIKKTLRKCRVLGGTELGKKLPNSTYTGMLQRQEVDLYLRGEPDYLHEDWLQKTKPVQIERVVVGHAVKERRTVLFLNVLENFYVGLPLTLTYLASILVILALSFLINELSRRVRFGATPIRGASKLRKRIAFAVRSFGVKRLSGIASKFPAVALFMLFVHLFVWFTQHFLINNLQTNQVVVDTSELVKNERDIFESKKILCMVKNDQLHNMITSLPTKKNLLSRIFERTRLKPGTPDRVRHAVGGDRCLLARGARVTELPLFNLFFVGERKAADVLLAVASMMQELLHKVWISDRTLYEYSRVIYYSKQPENKRRVVERAMLRRTESGLFVRWGDCVEQATKMSCRSSQISIIESLEAYIDEHSATASGLVLDNLKFVLLYYFLFCSLVFFTFCVHHLVRLANKRSRRLVKRTIVRLVSKFLKFRRSSK